MILFASVCGFSRAEGQRVKVDFFPDQLTVVVGRTEEIRILLSDSRSGLDVEIGNLRDVRVASKKPAVATVTRNDNVLRVTGVAPGIANIELTIGVTRKLLVVQVQAPTEASSSQATVAPPGAATPVVHSAPATAAQLVAERTEIHLLPGERERAMVYAAGPNGTRLPGVRISYQSLDTTLVSVDSTGEVHGLAPGGPAMVIATPPGGQSLPIRVTVEPSRLRIQPDSLLIYPTWRDTLRLTVPALGRNYRGPVTWSSSNPGVVSVDPQTGVLGRISPVDAVTTVTMWARSPAGEVSSSLRIFPQESKHQFEPEPGKLIVVPLGGASNRAPRDGLALNDRNDTLFTLPLQWEVADTTVAVLDHQRGLLTARRQDTTSLKATVLIRRQDSLRVVYRWTVRVVGAGVAANRARVGLRVGMQDTVRLLMLDTLRHPMTDQITGTWSASQTGRVVRLEPDGTIEALGPGRARLTGKSTWDSTVTVPVIVASDFYYVVSSRPPDGKPYSELRGVDLHTRAQRRITSTPGTEGSPAVSPDRTRIAFVRIPPGGSPDIYVADADGENVVNITGDTLLESAPTWSHDGSKLFFLRQDAGTSTSRVFIADVDGGPSRLFLDQSPIHSIAVSPDGKRMVYSTVRNGQYDLYSVPLTTAGPLGPAGIESAWYLSPENEVSPQFTTNGDLFFIQKGGKGTAAGPTLMRMRANGATPEPITSAAFQVLSFAVAADGNRIVFVGQPTTRDARKQGQALYYIDLNQSPIPGEPLLVNDPQSTPLTPAFTP